MTSNLTFLPYFYSIERGAKKAFDFLASLSLSLCKHWFVQKRTSNEVLYGER